MRSIELFLRLAVAFVLHKSLQCSELNPPKITLDGFALADSFLTWNTNLSLIPMGSDSNDTMFVVPSSIRGLSLLCNASYPVEWTFHREKWNQRTTWQTMLVNSRGSDPKNLDPLWYSVELRFLGHNVEITGNYTCQKYGQDVPSKSVFVFWEGSSPPYLTLLASGSHKRTVNYNPGSSSSFVIPCTVSRPDIIVKLYGDNQTEEIRQSDNVKYNPAIGFTILNASNKSLGVYKCTVGSPDDEDSLEFEVKNGKPTQEFEDQLWNAASVSYDASKRQIVCCSSTRNKPPIMGHFYCGHPTTCQLQKHALHKIETASHRSTQDNCAFLPLRMLFAGVFRCKGDSIDIVREYFFPMMQSYQRFSTSNTTMTPYFSWTQAVPESMMILTNFTDPFYVGETKRFVCRASRFYFSQGIHWTLTYENETINVQGNQTQSGRNHSYGIFQQGNYAIIELRADIGLQKLTCNAPIWNQTDWGKKSLSFKIELPTAPKLDGSAEEEMTWPTTLKFRLLYCRFHGIPKPRVTWMKNDKTINNAGSITQTNGSISSLNITRYDFVQATFTCNVTNVGGSVTKVFKVYISNGVSLWKTGLYAFGVVGLLLAFAGGSFAVWKMKQQKIAIRHLANVAFKDVNAVAAATQQSAVPVDIHTFPSENGSNGNSCATGGSEPFSEGNSAPEFGRYQKM